VRFLYLCVAVAAVSTASAIASFMLPPFPRTIDVDAIIASDEQGGLTEGCGAFYYRLSADTIGHLNEDGIAFLQRGPKPRREDLGNPYGAWIETPGEINRHTNGSGPVGSTIYGLYALSGYDSSDEKLKKEANKISEALEMPGSYYTTTANREGIIIVSPKRGTAAYLYFG